MSIAPTLSIDAATEDVWDVVVIGAGPAGAVAARQLAAGGAKALLVDRCAFPRSKVCGACVNPQALSLLATIGLKERVHRLSGVPLRRLEVRSPWHSLQLSLASSLAVSRSQFDAALVEAAIEAGASFLPETTATLDPVEEESPEHRTVRLACKNRPERCVVARVVLAADGLGQSSLRRDPQFQSRAAAQARIGLGAVIEATLDPLAPGTIYMAMGDGGYVGMVRIERDCLNVAAALAPQRLKGHGGPAAAVAALLREARMPELPGLASATWHGTVPLTRQTTQLASRRVFVLGDAAGYVEPFTGEGMGWAIGSALAVTPIAMEAMARWSPSLASRWARTHRELIQSRQGICRLIAAGSRRPAAVRGVLALLSRFPSLSESVARRVSGPSARRRVHSA